MLSFVSSTRAVVIVAAALFIGAACERPSATHADVATVVPGSHEDWCEEHGVAESQCTRCNPALIPAFKATKDWCPEHQRPESQCTICHPDLKIVRPAKKG